MTILEDTFTAALAVALSAACELPTRVEAVRPLGDTDLLAAQATLADTRRALDAAASLVAGEIAHRSRRELGYDGLAQRIALAARDGGCRFTNCGKPPAHCEAHHVQHWKRDKGRTDIADGILLCRYHHLLVHNNKWQITRDAHGYWLTPPPDTPGTQRRLMPTLSAALSDLLNERA